jgi:hypothetical protein
MGALESPEETRSDPEVQRRLHLRLVEFGRDKRSAAEDTVTAILVRVPAYRLPGMTCHAGMPAHREFWRCLGLSDPLDMLADEQAVRASRAVAGSSAIRAA